MVYSTKYRKPVLEGRIADYLKKLHVEIAEEKGVLLRGQEVLPDHVHLFITAHPKFSPAQLSKIFKGITGKFILEKFPNLKKLLHRGHLWNPSYYVGTVGDVTKETIQKYIKLQASGPRKRGRPRKADVVLK